MKLNTAGRNHLNRQKIINRLKKRKLLFEQYHIKKLGLFGSYFHDTHSLKSDIDFLVELEKPSFDDLINLSFELEGMFKKRIDLITIKGLSRHMKPFIKNKVAWIEV